MQHPLVKAVIKEPYYEVPKWLNTKLSITDYVVLSGEATNDEVDMFIATLLGYNGVRIEGKPQEVIENLIKETDVIIGGGILFADETKQILPSCCSGLEAWRDVLQGVIEQTSPWMGHDPSPCMTFSEGKVRVWSDDCLEKESKNHKRNELHFIEYGRKNLIAQLNKVEQDLLHFAQAPLYNRISMFDQRLASKLAEKFKEWFITKEWSQ
ncbi:hypothetical protein NST23_15730 [Brevibacillus sp. FSL K6-0770]|uniref:hypothetical protein n=1 Tax=Brevibacillus sp. FSL K6-0770 TaxID=2954673 RepID=UPI0030F56C68